MGLILPSLLLPSLLPALVAAEETYMRAAAVVRALRRPEGRAIYREGRAAVLAAVAGFVVTGRWRRR